jgi:UDP-N-acetyl-D-glucosamine/UDP-N-acetyl-D-galactosamine dehydrogenase
MTKQHKPTIVILGLGYVGLPLAVHFSHHYRVIGLDINEKKIEELRASLDRMGEIATEELKRASIEYTTDPSKINEGDIIIAAVPTPVDDHNVPDLSPVHSAAHMIGKYIKKGAIAVFESTVYPGVTEEECVPIIEQESGLTFNTDFFAGYSPERINPGDKEHTIDKVMKIVSGSTPETAQRLKEVYGTIVTAGIHVAPSIHVAEAAKVIENIQRDINIALVNELAMLFDRLDINVHDVLAAAGTKWNFHRYTPGLVGGHCIGVDPYYLTYKAIEVNYHPNIILAGRRINDRMHSFYTQKLIKELNKKSIATNRARVAVLGLTFKENCSDYRNSRTKYLIKELKEYGVQLFGVDPWLSDDIIKQFGAVPATVERLAELGLDAVIITVPHEQFLALSYEDYPVVLDIKGKIVKRERF